MTPTHFLVATALLTACTVGESGGSSPGRDSGVAGDTGGGNIDAPPSTIDAPPSSGTGSLIVTFTSTPTAGGGGQFAPRNVDVVWVEAAAAPTFVKTIGRWAATRKGSLVAWNIAAGPNDVDAVSGATQAAYATPLTTMTWDLKDRLGVVVPDGTYTVRMESTDLNANTAAQNNQGTFTFVKSAAPQNQTGLTNGGFTNVSITFTP